MPAQSKNPKDRPRVKAKELQALATLALTVKSEVDLRMAAWTLDKDREEFFTIDERTVGRDRFFSVSREKEWSWIAKPTPVRSIRWLPLLVERAKVILDSDSYSIPNIETKTKNQRKCHQISVSDAYQFLVSLLSAIAELQGLGYQLNATTAPLINAYLAVLLDHHQASSSSKRRRSKGAPKLTHEVHVPITRWASMIAAFKGRQQHSHYPDLHLLEGSDSARKRAGKVAQDIGLIRIRSTRVVEVLPAGAEHHKDCLTAINANQPLPDPFSR
jgi:hypothetical protein